VFLPLLYSQFYPLFKLCDFTLVFWNWMSHCLGFGRQLILAVLNKLKKWHKNMGKDWNYPLYIHLFILISSLCLMEGTSREPAPSIHISCPVRFECCGRRHKRWPRQEACMGSQGGGRGTRREQGSRGRYIVDRLIYRTRDAWMVAVANLVDWLVVSLGGLGSSPVAVTPSEVVVTSERRNHTRSVLPSAVKRATRPLH
jgi:hypothetical protein